MLQQTANEPQGCIAELAVAVFIIENRLAIPEQLHMYMHAAAGLVGHWLGQEGGRAAGLHGGVLDDILGDHGVVGHLGHLTQLHFHLQLAAAADFVVVVFDLNAPVFHPQTNPAAQVVE